MVFTPALPLTGIGGWRFLERTYDLQLETFNASPQVKNDLDYMNEALSGPVAIEDFLDDRRLLRVTMTAFGLEGEEWKRGFIDKALEEITDPDSTFLQRLDNRGYTRFAETFAPVDGMITLSAAARAELTSAYEAEAFEIAVGDVDSNMRLALNFQRDVESIMADGASDEAIMFRLLGNVPVRTVLESALNLPIDVRQLTIERQAEIFDERLQSVFGLQNITELQDTEVATEIIERFHAIEATRSGPSALTPGATALTLLGGGFGSQASQNLFLGTIG